MLETLWLCVTAAAAGVVNAIAGGGTLLTFPALTAALPRAVAEELANGTSTLALLPGSAASAWGYRRELAACRRWLVLLAPPSLLGGGLGALLVHQESFRVLVPWLILTAAVLFLLQPLVARLVKWRTPAAPPSGAALALIAVMQFLVAVYGGYFGAGIGILMLSSLSFLGLESIHEVNGLKTVLAFCINGVAAGVFVARGLVVWPFAVAMALAAIVGGYAGARLALKLKPALVRWVVIVIGFGLAAYYFYRQYAAAGANLPSEERHVRATIGVSPDAVRRGGHGS